MQGSGVGADPVWMFFSRLRSACVSLHSSDHGDAKEDGGCLELRYPRARPPKAQLKAGGGRGNTVFRCCFSPLFFSSSQDVMAQLWRCSPHCTLSPRTIVKSIFLFFFSWQSRSILTPVRLKQGLNEQTHQAAPLVCGDDLSTYSAYKCCSLHRNTAQ